jgi:serine/threonine protein kinase
MSEEQWRSKWALGRELGAGGQGTTYEVTSLADPTTRGVLKLLKDDSDPQARSRMAKEAINLVTLAKKAVKVPGLLDDNTDQYANTAVQLYLVMEYVPGNTLDKELEIHGRRLSLEKSVRVALALCETIASMHEEEMLHRDLKPANLMVRNLDTDDIVVLDLGLSYDRQANQETLTRKSETIKNELLALPEATIPGGDRRGERSDVTNIVGVFFYCLTGALPRSLRDERDRPPHHREGLRMRDILAGDSRWDQVEFLLDTGFAVDIESRFQTVDELRERLLFVLNRKASNNRDPIQAAIEIGARIRRKDRPLQVLEFLPCASALEEQILTHVRSMATKIPPPFSLSLGGIGVNVPLPTGVDTVKEFGAAITIAMHTRANTRIIHLRFGAKGDRCALFRMVRVNRPGTDVPPTTWEEVAWFDPAHPPEQTRVTGWIDELLVTAMRDFESD